MMFVKTGLNTNKKTVISTSLGDGSHGKGRVCNNSGFSFKWLCRS
jgi:hypothetical protein